MSIFKCKMCGGTLEINNNESVATCEYCGTQQTLPRLDDEKKANLYDRANHFRRNNDYDKAMGIYETILNEDKTDAEAYWSLVLCRYGIEYVEDPASHKRIPTVNRAQFTSVFDDDNYKSALQYADGYQKTVYEEEAKAINEIQKGILEISQKEEPFDVFICYKETDNNGRRTQDSVLANDLYHQLTQEGFKVFFARITLEDKLGSAYEPYIFAALNSAKVMVVLGTKPEYFNAVWVKNEWSRYLSLIKSGAKKMLIPAYKDMDPYDLPEEFSHLQAQDMSKLGFMQDLIRGIKKIAQTDEPKTTVVKETVVTGGNTNTAPLLKRAFMFLEDGDWQSADEYCEKVLDLDPECARAYLGKLMAELEVRKQELLGTQAEEFTDSINYQKACRFADNELKSALDDYAKNVIYLKAQRTMTVAKEESNFKSAASIFARVKGYKDADSKKSECLEKAEACRKDAIYNIALENMECGTIVLYNSAISAFETIKGWKDSDEKIALCKRRIEEIKAEEESERLERERRKQEAIIEAEKRKKLIKKIAAIATPIAAVLVVFIIVLNAVIMPQINYKKALNEVKTGNYSNAYMLFEKHPDYKDTQDQIKIAKTKEAFSLLDAKKYDDAYAILKGIGNTEAIAKSKYERSVTYIDSGEYAAAFLLLNDIDYKDSKEKAKFVLTKCIIDENILTAKVGDYIKFGSYEQDNNIENGKEDIEWKVLAKEENRILVISKYALDCKPYNTSNKNVTWETCTLRKWLNNDFINSAFSENEKAIIPMVTITADTNPNYSTNPGNNTQDKVFLLSITEAEIYFSSESARQCQPSNYAKEQGAYINRSSGNCWWWLRSLGYNQDFAANVYYDGSISFYGDEVTIANDCVRPAMWIALDS